MHSYNIVYMDLALEDVAEIKRYLSNFYPGTWPRFADKLERGISGLSAMPYICEAWQPKPTYRRLVVDKYLVFYKVLDAEKTIQIHRILHGSRNIQRFLNF